MQQTEDFLSRGDIEHGGALGQFDFQQPAGDPHFLERVANVIHQGYIQQVVAGQVDGDRNFPTLIQPVTQLANGLAQHIATEQVDHAALFDEVDEEIGGQQSMNGVYPARQRLDAANLVVLQVDLGLVEKHELIFADGLVQLAAQGNLEFLVGVVAAGEKAHAATQALGLMQGDIRATQQFLERVAVIGQPRHARAGADAERPVVDLGGLVTQIHGCLGESAGLAFVGFVEPYGEFIAAVAKQFRTSRQHPLQPFGDLYEQLIAHIGSGGVVDFLEVVQINDQQGRRRDIILGAAHIDEAFVAIQKQHAVTQAGQHIVSGLVHQAISRFGDSLGDDAGYDQGCPHRQPQDQQGG